MNIPELQDKSKARVISILILLEDGQEKEQQEKLQTQSSKFTSLKISFTKCTEIEDEHLKISTPLSNMQ